jgi:hypothetical protein
LKGTLILLTPFLFVGIEATQRISPFKRFDNDKGFFSQAIANFNVLPSPSTSIINPEYLDRLNGLSKIGDRQLTKPPPSSTRLPSRNKPLSEERQLARLEPPIIVSFRDFQSENSEPCIRGVIAISVGGESGIN